ncbi:MAG: alpha/beta fold hydrolase [Betaproteobacteria bacterium]|nr:alpha/beta fold hydrolase [Betaproteobacteria bacterium]
MDRTRLLRRLLLAAAAIAALSAGGCAMLEAKQRELIFRPNKESYGIPADYGLAFEELWLEVKRSGAEVERVHGWWMAAEEADAPALLYLHGARRNISNNLFRIAGLRRMGFSVLAIDYRGFGLSDGELPSENQTYEDAQAAWEEFKRRVPDPRKRIIYGHSLGGAVAIDLAVRNPDAAGLIAESTLTSIRDMVDLSPYRFLPVGLIQTQYYDSLAKVGSLRVPVLFVHGAADRWVPPSMSERLYAAAPEPKKLLLVENAGHSNSLWVAPQAYRRALREFSALARQAALSLRPSRP